MLVWTKLYTYTIVASAPSRLLALYTLAKPITY